MAGDRQRARVVAVLSRAPGLPEGDPRAGIEITAFLDPNGALDATAPPGIVRRYWPDREDWTGELVSIDEGWGIRETGSGDDAPVWALQGGVLRPGAYVTLVRPTNEESVFRVVNVEPL
jgi:hypothetical protein